MDRDATPLADAAALPALAHRDAWVEVDLDAIFANTRALGAWVGGRARIAPVVKANAYGHGAIPVSRALATAGFGPLCVATVDEGLALRGAGLDGDVIVLYGPPLRALQDAADARLDVTLGDTASVEWVARLPATERRALRLQLKIDTGMTRQGLRLDELGALGPLLAALAGSVRGVWTHLADGADVGDTTAQLARFDDAVARLRGLGVEAPRHVAGSAAVLAGVGRQYEFARPGLALYGAVPAEFGARPEHLGATPIALRAAMAVRARPSRVVEVPAGTAVGYSGTFTTERSSRLATLPLGYADGLRRSLGDGRGQVLVGAMRAPIVGRISMDSCVVDVTDVEAAGRDSVFTLLGRDGPDAITLEEMARWAGTIPHEMAVGFAARLPYVYRPSGAGRAD
jgi:alanine racemase